MKNNDLKKAIALYGTKMSARYIVKCVVCFVLAAVIWYIIAATLPYALPKDVSFSDNEYVSVENLSASAEDVARADSEKERALFMPSGADSFMRRLKLVSDAQSTIDFMIHKSYEQDYPMYFYAALLDAADRNVKVRIILDGKLGTLDGTLDKIGKLLQNHKNIEFYYFNTANILDPSGLMTLLHDKIMVVDGNKAIVGGVNMGTDNYLKNYDFEVLISNSGPDGTANALKRYFNQMIDNSLTRRIVSNFKDLGLKTQYIENYKQFFGRSELATEKIDYNALGVPIDKCTHLFNEITDGKKSPKIFRGIFNLARNSKSVTMVTPYILIGDDKKSELKDIAATCNEFKIITNSLYNTRNVAYADYYYTRKSYLTVDIELYEYQDENQLHAKIYTFDNRYTVIGSFNMDERSAHIDTESVLVIDSPEFTAIVNNYIDNVFVKNSLKVGEDNNYVQSDTVTAPPVPRGKQIKYRFYRILGVIRYLI